MKYTDHGFRPLYKNFCIYPLTGVIKEMLKDQTGIDEATGVMVYGYIDHDNGNRLELVGFANNENERKYTYARFTDDARYTVKIEDVIDEEFIFADYGDSHLYEQFKDKVDPLAEYNVDASLEETRKMTFLDEFRYDKNFDDVKVVLYKEGLGLEGVWARIESLGNGAIMGTLMNEPNQDFGIKAGMPFAFVVHEDEDKKKTLIANMAPRKKYKAEDLADGKVLKSAIVAFNKNKNQFRLFSVLELLRDSKVVVPYNKGGVEILTSKGKPFFPVFSDMIETWVVKDDLEKKEMPFLEALEKAKIKNSVVGIVVNPYSDAFIIPRALFDMIPGIESRIEE